uniref:G_PROTEIN_RECEP_F1_2 domain-containing protein n=1 Tax=Rhabditophanes sp. KR3021 TaxID=114890 RepID=A0AC35UDU2_9BILA
MLFYSTERFNNHYNCNSLTDKEWDSEGHPNITLGIIYITSSIPFFIATIPCLMVMLKKEFRKNSVYQILFLQTLTDIIGIIISSYISGFYTIIGATFCKYRVFNYILGHIGGFNWSCAGMTTILLVFNRIVDLSNPFLAKSIFDGNKTLIWLVLPIIYGLLYSLFVPPVIFSSSIYTFAFNPFVGTSLDSKMSANYNYTSILQPINNFFISGIISFLYIILCALLIKKSNVATKSENMSKIQRNLIIQSILICFPIHFNAVMYTFFQYISINLDVIIFSHGCWIFTHSIPSVIYIVFNSSIRNCIANEYLGTYFQKNKTLSIQKI